MLLRNLTRAASEARASIESPLLPLTSEELVKLFTWGKTDAGVDVTPTNALGVTAVYRAMALIGGVAAALPIKAYRTEGSLRDGQEVTGRRRIEVHSEILAEPHHEQTPFEFWETCYAHMLGWGNAYRFKTRNQLGKVVRLSVIPPDRVKVGRADDGTKVFAVTLDSGEVRPYTQEEILHLPAFGYDGLVGLSMVSVARQAVGLALAAEKYGARLFGNGSLMSGILTTERRLEETAATALKKRWQEKVSGVDQSHEIAVLDSGAKFQPVSIPPEDAQFLETRRFSVTEFARLFGIPPHLLMETDASTSWGTGIESQNTHFVTYSLSPWIVRRDQRVSKELLPRGTHAETVLDALLRGSTIERYQAYGTAIKDGWLKRSEARERENLEVDDPKLNEYLDPASAGGGGGGGEEDADAVASPTEEEPT